MGASSNGMGWDLVAEPEELVTLTEIARRVRDLGYAERMSRQRVVQLAETDPNWPVPKEQWKQVGRYWLLPWPPIEAYFQQRSPSRGGPRGWRRDPGRDNAAADQ
jgi:hypothetical protein